MTGWEAGKAGLGLKKIGREYNKQMAGLVEQLSKQIDNHKVIIQASEDGIELCDRIIKNLQNMKLTSNVFQNSIKIRS